MSALASSQRDILRPKALIVQCDYFALTSKVDPNVIFWNPNQTAEQFSKAGPDDFIIPKGVGVVWMSSFVTDEQRKRISDEAKLKDIVIWNFSQLVMRERLRPYWASDRNRSDPPPLVISIGGAYGETEYERARRSSPLSRDKMAERLALLKEIGKRREAPDSFALLSASKQRPAKEKARTAAKPATSRFSDEQKRAISERISRYWAERRAGTWKPKPKPEKKAKVLKMPERAQQANPKADNPLIKEEKPKQISRSNEPTGIQAVFRNLGISF